MSGGHFIRDYWNYYLDLEKEVIEIRKYVEFAPGNYSTYSMRFYSLLQVICCEVEVIGKLIIAFENNPQLAEKRNCTISDWGNEVLKVYPNLKSRCVCLLPSRKEMQPFKDYEKDADESTVDKKKPDLFPIWWKHHNDLKHQRMICLEDKPNNFSKANLENVLNALGGLFLLERSILEKEYNISGNKDIYPAFEMSHLFCLLSDFKIAGR